jgi:ABC-type branched-subunit amino acid transport system permease subunit
VVSEIFGSVVEDPGMNSLWKLLSGPEDIGQSVWFWIGFAALIGFFLYYPAVISEFAASSISYYLLNIPLALGLCLLWGYAGVLSFGQVAYFGIAGYVYGVVAGNMIGNPWGPLVGSISGLIACAIIAAIFGYFVFYARVQIWIAPILTLVFTLLLETFLGQTAGYQWRIGSVQLGGYNGMTGIPSFQLGNLVFFGYSFYYYVLIVVLICFLACRMLVSSRHGHVLLAIREDPVRTELFGYDIRARQLVIFVIAAVLAGVSGLLYVQWGNYITPTQVGLLQAALPVIWVAVGGRDSLIAVAITTYLLNWLTYALSSAGNQYALVIIGALLLGVMLFFPKGIIVTLARELPRRGWRSAFMER